MERLTGRDAEGVYLKLKHDDDRVYCTDGREFINAYYGKKLLDKLAEFEDFMEENEFGTLCDLKCAVDVADVMGKLSWQTAKELEAYKKAWGELKGYFGEPLFWTQDMIAITRGAEYEQCRKNALKKMHELEPKGEGDE